MKKLKRKTKPKITVKASSIAHTVQGQLLAAQQRITAAQSVQIDHLKGVQDELCASNRRLRDSNQVLLLALRDVHAYAVSTVRAIEKVCFIPKF